MRFGVLGPLRVTVRSEPVDIGSPNQRRLLTALLVHAGAVVSTDRLVEALWRDEAPATAVESLRTYVYRLRDTLDDDGVLIATRPSGYVLEVDDRDIDAYRFEQLVTAARRQADARARLDRLEEALGLWRGPAYAEFADEEVVRVEAARLEELRRTAEERRFDTQLALGDHAEAVGDLEAFVAHHPLRERARGQLMLALYRCGRQADALAAYRAFRELLDEELGLEPSDELRSLEGDILRRSPSLDAPPTTQPVVLAGGGEPVDAPSGAGWPDGVTGTLPAEPTELFGRDDDVAEVRGALTRARLVTVVGVGGVGKTRLALRVARQEAADDAGGVWWCELAEVGVVKEVAAAVATALGIRASEGGDVVGAVIDFLRARKALLVLDNCEHVARGVEPLVHEVVAYCPGTAVLATSRAPLGVAGERVHRLAPLPVGAGEGRDAGDSPALALFEARSHAVRPELQVDAAERARMAEICRRLDGLPLAIELAASRLRSLNPTDLADRLDDRFDVLVDRHQQVGRHQGLRAVLDWSHSLLGTVEQRLFARLSVFAGPFTLEAAEQVAGGDGVAHDEVLDLLTGLVDHSLVSVLPSGGVTRYGLLETLRAYGRQRLQEAGEEQAVHRRHAEYHVGLAEDADVQVRGRDEALGVIRLDRVLHNLRAAHRWAVDQQEVDLAVRLVAALFRYALWRLRDEVLGWAGATGRLPGAEAHPAFPTLAGMAGWAAGLRGDHEAAVGWAERGLAALDGPDDPRAVPPLEVRMHTAMWRGDIAGCLEAATWGRRVARDPDELVPHYIPGLALTYAGRPEEALDHVDDAQAAADRVGNPSMRALVRYARGEALVGSDPRRALGPLKEAAELAAAVDNRMVLGVVDVSLVSLQARHGEAHEALDTFVAVIDRLHNAGDWTHLWTGLRGLVGLLAQLGQDEDAGVLLGAVREADSSPPVYGEDAERLAAAKAELAERLGDHALADAQARGRAMSDHEAIGFARGAINRARRT